MNGTGGITGMGYTGIGVTGQDVLIYGNLLVTGGIDPTYLALTPQASGPVGFINPLWVDNSGFLRSENIKLENATDDLSLSATSIAKTGAATPLGITASSVINITPSSGNNCNVLVDGAGNFAVSQSSAGGPTQPIVEIINTNGSAQAGHIDIYKNTNTPATNDGIGALSYHANNASATKVEYARIQADQRDITAGSENGSISVLVCENSATPVEYLRVNGSAGTTDLYKGLNIQTQNITGTTGGLILTNIITPGVLSKSTAVASSYKVEDTAVASTYSALTKTSLSVQNSQDQMDYNSSQITKTGLFSLNMTSQTGFNLVGTNAPFTINAGTSTVQITTPAGGATKLTTDLFGNAVFYPDIVVDNGNASTVAVPLPVVIHQRLTLNNLGLGNTSIWDNYGSPIFSGFSAVAIDAGGKVWLADINGSGDIQVWDSTLSSQLFTISTSAGGGSVNINVIKQVGGYVFVGGNFTSVNGNATAQYGITRFDYTTCIEDPIYDGAGGVNGVQIGAEVYCMEEVNTELVIGGNFSSMSTGLPALHIGKITNPFGPSGSQSYGEFNGGVNAKVFSIYQDTATNYTYVGGDFTQVNSNLGALGYFYCAYYDNNLASWFNVAGNNINAPVSIIKGIPAYAQIWVGGSFGPVGGVGQQYNTYIDPSNPSALWFDSGLLLTQPPLYKQAFYSAGIGTLGVILGADFYISSAYGIWTSLGSYGGSGLVSGVNYWNGDWKVVLEADSFVRSHSTLPHSCIFTGSFKYDNTSYGNYTITTRNVSQQFIGDTACSFWSIIGQGVGTFS